MALIIRHNRQYKKACHEVKGKIESNHKTTTVVKKALE